MQATTTNAQGSRFTNRIFNGNCIEAMRQMPANSVDLVLTDPPYLVNYRDRAGRTIRNDVNADWLIPAMCEAYRLLKSDHLAIMFYGWSRIDAFFDAGEEAGFQPVGHIIFRKTYCSRGRFLRYHHEQAYLLAKGNPALPRNPLADIIDMPYSGNKLHPTQKPIAALAPLIRSFTRPGEIVLDPFAGSGSTCAAALLMNRMYVGVELDRVYFEEAEARLERVAGRVAARRQPLPGKSSSSNVADSVRNSLHQRSQFLSRIPLCHEHAQTFKREPR